MTPDITFPLGRILQKKLASRRRPVSTSASSAWASSTACSSPTRRSGRLRQDGAARRRGDPRRVHAVQRGELGLLVRPHGDEADSEEFAWNTRFRDRIVLFGDGGAAVVLKAAEGDGRGVIDSILRTDGNEYERLIVPGVGFKHRPYVDAAQIQRGDHVPIVEDARCSSSPPR